MGFLKRLKKEADIMPHGKVISFLNQKGGVGKTTMAFNTAMALKQKGYKVLALDLDPQGNLSQLFKADQGKNLFHLLINSIRELQALHTPLMWQDILYQHEGVDLLPGGQDLSGFELTVAGIQAPRQLILKKLIEKWGLLELYDYIIIDAPPTLGLLVVNILCATYGVMIPFRPDQFSFKGLSHFYHVLEQVEEMGITQVPKVLAHIPNLVDLRRKQEVIDLKMITLESEEMEVPVVNPFLNRNQLVRSQAMGKSVFAFESREFKGIQQQFRELADLIATSH